MADAQARRRREKEVEAELSTARSRHLHPDDARAVSTARSSSRANTVVSSTGYEAGGSTVSSASPPRARRKSDRWYGEDSPIREPNTPPLNVSRDSSYQRDPVPFERRQRRYSGVMQVPSSYRRARGRSGHPDGSIQESGESSREYDWSTSPIESTGPVDYSDVEGYTPSPPTYNPTHFYPHPPPPPRAPSIMDSWSSGRSPLEFDRSPSVPAHRRTFEEQEQAVLARFEAMMKSTTPHDSPPGTPVGSDPMEGAPRLTRKKGHTDFRPHAHDKTVTRRSARSNLKD